MKKATLVLLMTFGLLLFGGEHDNSEYEHFNNYRNEQTFENFKIAADHYNSKLEENENDHSAYLMLSYLNSMELENNLAKLENDLDSLDNRTKFSYANLLLSLGKYDESIQVYDKLNTDTPNWSCPWRHKGEAYFKSNKLIEAESALLKSIETRIEHYDAYIMLADVQKEMGKFKLALETLKTGISYKGKDIEDPEKEVSDLDVEFLHLELLKLNNKIDDFNKLKKKLKKLVPEDERWEKIH